MNTTFTMFAQPYAEVAANAVAAQRAYRAAQRQEFERRSREVKSILAEASRTFQRVLETDSEFAGYVSRRFRSGRTSDGCWTNAAVIGTPYYAHYCNSPLLVVRAGREVCFAYFHYTIDTGREKFTPETFVPLARNTPHTWWWPERVEWAGVPYEARYSDGIEPKRMSNDEFDAFLARLRGALEILEDSRRTDLYAKFLEVFGPE
jgi:hypothetical protein